jgi:hypothetical protein
MWNEWEEKECILNIGRNARNEQTSRTIKKENIELGLRELEWGHIDWIDLAQNGDRCRALVNTVLNRRVPFSVRKFLNGYGTISLSGKNQLHGVSQFS